MAVIADELMFVFLVPLKTASDCITLFCYATVFTFISFIKILFTKMHSGTPSVTIGTATFVDPTANEARFTLEILQYGNNFHLLSYNSNKIR
jgi:hypothetical protein